MHNRHWFDSSLKDLRYTLDMYCKQLSLDSFNKKLRQKCFELSRKYTRMRKRKRKVYFHTLISTLDSLQSEKPKEYWNITDSIKHESASEDTSCIDPHTWKAYLESLGTVPEKT